MYISNESENKINYIKIENTSNLIYNNKIFKNILNKSNKFYLNIANITASTTSPQSDNYLYISNDTRNYYTDQKYYDQLNEEIAIILKPI